MSSTQPPSVGVMSEAGCGAAHELVDELVGGLGSLAAAALLPLPPCHSRLLTQGAGYQTGCLATGRRWRGRGVPMLTVTLRLCTRRHGRR
eukprot:COSAG03_NODE_131_length_11966_cov_5.210163_5_plen_90_part_00